MKTTLFMINFFLTPGIRLRKAKKQIKANFNLYEDKYSITAKDLFKILSETTHKHDPAMQAHGAVTMSSMVYNMVLLNMLKTNGSESQSKSIG